MTKAIILAAGQGTRLRPLTDDKPKTMVEINGKSIIENQLETLGKQGIKEKHVVAGYKQNVLNFPDLSKHINPVYDSTNMVASLFVAESLFKGDSDVLIAYGDIIFDEEVLSALCNNAGNQISIAYDLNWFQLWSERMPDPLSDVESFKVDKNSHVRELGKKVTNAGDVQGQYIGLIYVSAGYAPKFFDLYKSLIGSDELFDGKDFDNMYMTTYLQMQIDKGIEVKGVPIKGGWVEIDSVEDKTNYERLIADGRMSEFCKTLS